MTDGRRSSRHSWVVLCDFDGTISRLDGTDALLQAFALPGWEPLEARWQAGDLTALDCMRGQIALLAVSAQELVRFASELPLDETLPEFVAACAGRGFPVVVASDGLDQLILPALVRLGLSELPVSSGVLHRVAGDRYELTAPAASARCMAGSVTCKCAIANRLSEQPSGPRRKVLVIGDGRSDFCAATNVADFVFARGSLLEHCRQSAIACLAFESFSEAARLLVQLNDLDAASNKPPSPQRIQEPWLQT